MRVLLIVIAIVAIPLAMVVKRASARRRAIARIRAVGGAVTTTPSWIARTSPRWLAAWVIEPLRARIGDEYFEEATGVIRAGSSRLNDADLGDLDDLDGLTILDLSGGEITGAGLAHLAGLREVETLDLSHTDLSDAGIVFTWPG